MCYFLYGAINNQINTNDYDKIVTNNEFHFSLGTKQELDDSIEKGNGEFRITNRHCDCDTAIGSHKISKKELKEFEKFLKDLTSVRGIKHVYLSKNWIGEINEKTISVHIEDIDLLKFLADLEDNCLYEINLFKKYY